MPVVSIDLPEPLRDYAEEQAARAGHGDVGTFVRALLEASQELDQLEAKLLEACDGPFEPWTAADIDAIRTGSAERRRNRLPATP